MLDRRQLLFSGAAACVAIAARPALARRPGPSLHRLFDAFASDDLDASPETTTALGLDAGARAAARRQLDERTRGFTRTEKLRLAEQLKQLRGFDPAALRGMDLINYEVVLYGLESAVAANQRYDHGHTGAGAPYVISQLTGAYVTIPDFLDGQHPIASRADADAYVSRLAAFATAMDQEIEAVRHDVALGCAPPDFALAGARAQMRNLRAGPPREASLVGSLARRTKQRGIRGSHAVDAARIVRDQVYPALDRQLALVEELQVHATHDAGVWKLRRGDEYYADSLTAWTTSPLAPAEIHQLGLDAVADGTRRIDAIMKQQGRTTGTVSERLRGLFADPSFRYPDTELGRSKLLAELNAKVQQVRARLPSYFGVLPRANVVVKRVPPYMEAARPGGYYQPPSLSGERPGAYYINLRTMAEIPTWTLPNSAYHQSLPGHHMKGSVYQETKLPLIRKLPFYSAYLEGWSLYAEQLADEMGMYDDDPFGRIGFLHGDLLCAVRLVVDTGLHAMRWSRERAIRYYRDTLGSPDASATTEIERYCIWPGQACAYLLDKRAILALRDQARAALGPRFDLRQFHDAILSCGAVPQKVLAQVIQRYIEARPA
jgi:uncharacterized protein (DUF885 family)